MSKTFASKRGRRSSKRIDLTDLRLALEDQRVWAGVALVQRLDGEAQHYELEANDAGDKIDVLVSARLMPHGEPIVCRLGVPGAASPGGGVWAIPPEGSEVMVLLPNGELDHDPVIVCVLSNGGVPAGLNPTTIVVCAPTGGTVLVHDGSASGAEPLVKRSEFNSHTHGLPHLWTTGTHDSVVNGGILPVGADTDAPGAITGTVVLEAK